LTTFYVCKECTANSYYTEGRQICPHNVGFHQPSAVASKKAKTTAVKERSDDYTPSFPDDADKMDIEDGMAADLTDSIGSSLTLDFGLFDHPESRSYFENDFKGDGPKYLVSRCSMNIDDIVEALEEDEVKLHLCLTELCFLLSCNERELLVNMLNSVVDHTKKICSYDHKQLHDPAFAIPFHMAISKSVQDMRWMYMEGSYAILNNLPYPNVHRIDDHAYVSMCEIIRDMLAKNIPIDWDNDIVEKETGMDELESCSGKEVTRIAESR